MQAPLYIRALGADERIALEGGLRSSSGFTSRRCQMLLHSADGVHTTAIARTLHCNDQTVRNAIHDFQQRGLAALQPKSSRPHTTLTVFSERGCERLRALLTKARARLARTPASGPSSWPPKSVLLKASPSASSATKPSAPHSSS
ncbi:MAG: helix-turn-helix domain-containing protein [Roseiflexaceae bacterium]